MHLLNENSDTFSCVYISYSLNNSNSQILLTAHHYHSCSLLYHNTRTAHLMENYLLASSLLFYSSLLSPHSFLLSPHSFLLSPHSFLLSYIPFNLISFITSHTQFWNFWAIGFRDLNSTLYNPFSVKNVTSWEPPRVCIVCNTFSDSSKSLITECIVVISNTTPISLALNSGSSNVPFITISVCKSFVLRGTYGSPLTPPYPPLYKNSEMNPKLTCDP